MGRVSEPDGQERAEEEPAAPRPVSGTIRIRGLAERAASPEQPLGPEVIVPESVPLRIQSSPPETVGTAMLRRDEAGIWAEAVIRLYGDGEHFEVMRRDHPAAAWPYLAVGVARAITENGVIVSGEVSDVFLVRENVDPDLPVWEVVTDPPGECGRCGAALEYRDQFLRRDGRWTDQKVPDAWCPQCEDDWEHLSQLFFTDMKFCGCGDPDSVYGLIRDLLTLFQERSEAWERERQEHPPFGRMTGSDEAKAAWEKIKDRIGGGDGVYYAVLYWLDGSGMIEHGGSVGGSWLTAKGKHYLSLLRVHCMDDVDEVGLPHEGNGCGPGCRHWEASTEEWQKRELAKQAAP